MNEDKNRASTTRCPNCGGMNKLWSEKTVLKSRPACTVWEHDPLVWNLEKIGISVCFDCGEPWPEVNNA